MLYIAWRMVVPIERSSNIGSSLILRKIVSCSEDSVINIVDVLCTIPVTVYSISREGLWHELHRTLGSGIAGFRSVATSAGFNKMNGIYDLPIDTEPGS